MLLTFQLEVVNLLPTSRESAVSGDQQPSRDAKVLPDRKIRHVGAGLDRPAQQKSHRNFPTPALMFFRTGVLVFGIVVS